MNPEPLPIRDSGQPKRSLHGNWQIRLGAKKISLGRSGTLVISRAYEQAVLGLTSIAMAWRLGVSDFAPISMLLITNSLCIVGSNFGLATDLIGREVGHLSRTTIVRVRSMNSTIIIMIPLWILLTDGTARVVILTVSLIWGLSAEAFIRKSALLRLDMPGRAAIAEILGSSVLMICVISGFIAYEYAVIAVGIGLVGKHLTEIVATRGWHRIFLPSGESTWSLSVWMGSLINFAISNVDFVLVAWLVSAEAFSIYSLGFRIAAALVAQVGYVMDRVALADFGEAYRAHTLGVSYIRRRRQMFLIGAVAGATTAAVAPILPLLLGKGWSPVVAVVIILSIAVPWRMSGGLGLMAAIAVGQARQMALWESARLGLVAVTLAVAGLIGFRTFTIAAGAAAVLTTISYDRMALRFANMDQRSWLLKFAPVAILLMIFAALYLPT